MRIDVVTIFPELFELPLRTSIVGRAAEQGIVEFRLHDLREHGLGRHRSVDDYPYGGGAGMVMRPEPLFAAIEPLREAGAHVILLDPAGVHLTDALARELAAQPHLALVSGRYEGIDERVRTLVDREVSIGDYVLTGGELPALVLIDAVVRLLPGAIQEASHESDSFATGLLEHPQYTRPERFRDLDVPQVLLGGNHGEVDRWRRREALRRSVERRPDLLDSAPLTDEDRQLLAELEAVGPHAEFDPPHHFEPDLEVIVRVAVDLLTRGEHAALEALTNGQRVPASELAQAVSDYGRTLVTPPGQWWGLVEITPIEVPPGGFHVAAPLWTAEEGRSDLTLELRVRESDAGYAIAEILDLHVL